MNKIFIRREHKFLFWKTVFFILILFLVNTVSAAQCGNLVITPVTAPNADFIAWEYDTTDNIITASIDGILISDLDNQSGVIQYGNADGRNVGSHIVRITNSEDSGCNTSSILPPVKSSGEGIADVINLYLIFILGLICLIVGAFIPPVGLGASGFGIIGLTFYHSDGIVLILLYALLLIVGIIEAIVGSKDWL